MRKIVELKLLPYQAADQTSVRQQAIAKSGFPPKVVTEVILLKKSVDARGSTPIFLLQAEVFADEMPVPEPAILPFLKQVENAPPVIIVGAGPAGYFAALELIELGLKPIVLDRGMDVQARRRSLRAIQQFGVVDPHSNYCFGEGGAGTYSDGKLYTRSHKRGNIQKALTLLVEHGANPDILVEAHPHIGSNKLPKVVANIRETILSHGGEVHFGAHVTDFVLKGNELKGVIVNDRDEYLGKSTILATGHSARDIYFLLKKRQIKIEAKPFALGVRVEHPQPLIDNIQYGQSVRDEHLPASSYKLVCQVGGRGVFSFCMCPGGLVVPASTAPGELVVNGMSMSRRDSPYANSGVVVQIELADLPTECQQQGELATLYFQKMVEEKVFAAGDGSQKAPSQRMTDFVNKKISANLPDTSYIPGVYPGPVHDLLPGFVYERLRTGMLDFGKKMRGYFSEDTNVIATESRTSAPVRIPRDRATFMHPETKGLFPCGEGAGYAGGIISAAMDGQNVARAVAKYYSADL